MDHFGWFESMEELWKTLEEHWKLLANIRKSSECLWVLSNNLLCALKRALSEWRPNYKRQISSLPFLLWGRNYRQFEKFRIAHWNSFGQTGTVAALFRVPNTHSNTPNSETRWTHTGRVLVHSSADNALTMANAARSRLKMIGQWSGGRSRR